MVSIDTFLKNKEKKIAYYKEYYKTHKKDLRYYVIQRKYSLTKDDFDKLLRDQNYRCAICNKPFNLPDTHNIYIDHNHRTGKVRGLLCPKCNSGIGYFEDNPEYLDKAFKYLKERD